MDIKDNHELCETKLLKKGDRFFLHIMIRKDVLIREHYQGVLSIDLGLRQPVVSVALPGRDTMLEGDRIRDTQTRYFYLRRNTRYGSNRSRFYDRKYNIVEDEIHKITTKLVRYAKENDLMIVVGNLKEIQNADKGRCMNRKLHRWPHYKFRQYLEYKAHWNGIEYKEIEETYTSQICSRCNYIGDRNKGLFKCDNCGLEIHSDKNGAQNIGRRALGKFTKPLSRAGDSGASRGSPTE